MVQKTKKNLDKCARISKTRIETEEIFPFLYEI